MFLQLDFLPLSLHSFQIISPFNLFRLPKEAKKNSDFYKKLKNVAYFVNFELRPKVYFYLDPDSYSRPQTRESVESAKNGLEYESFEYESRLDTALVGDSGVGARRRGNSCSSAT